MDTSERILLALGDIREDIGALGADVRSIDRRLDALEQALKDHAADDNTVAARVSSLEHSRTRMMTIVSFVSAGMSGLVALGASLLKGSAWAP